MVFAASSPPFAFFAVMLENCSVLTCPCELLPKLADRCRSLDSGGESEDSASVELKLTLELTLFFLLLYFLSIDFLVP